MTKPVAVHEVQRCGEVAAYRESLHRRRHGHPDHMGPLRRDQQVLHLPRIALPVPVPGSTAFLEVPVGNQRQDDAANLSRLFDDAQRPGREPVELRPRSWSSPLRTATSAQARTAGPVRGLVLLVRRADRPRRAGQLRVRGRPSPGRPRPAAAERCRGRAPDHDLLAPSRRRPGQIATAVRSSSWVLRAKSTCAANSSNVRRPRPHVGQKAAHLDRCRRPSGSPIPSVMRTRTSSGARSVAGTGGAVSVPSSGSAPGPGATRRPHPSFLIVCSGRHSSPPRSTQAGESPMANTWTRKLALVRLQVDHSEERRRGLGGERRRPRRRCSRRPPQPRRSP